MDGRRRAKPEDVGEPVSKHRFSLGGELERADPRRLGRTCLIARPNILRRKQGQEFFFPPDQVTTSRIGNHTGPVDVQSATCHDHIYMLILYTSPFPNILMYGVQYTAKTGGGDILIFSTKTKA